MIPRRSWSYLGVERCIISTAQQARPKVIGHKELWRAQLATWSSVVLRLPSSVQSKFQYTRYGHRRKTNRTYCIAPSFFSWLGKGTSFRIFPEAVKDWLDWGRCSSAVADFVGDVDNSAACWTLRGYEARAGRAAQDKLLKSKVRRRQIMLTMKSAWDGAPRYGKHAEQWCLDFCLKWEVQEIWPVCEVRTTVCLFFQEFASSRQWQLSGWSKREK